MHNHNRLRRGRKGGFHMAGPLRGLKILDFSTLLPGPIGTMILADLGADILKVEAPYRLDLIRYNPPFEAGESTLFHALNRSKRSIAIDLKQPEGVEIVKKLLGEYDVLLEQFRPGVMEKFGLGYHDLKEANPGLIYCSLSGFGQTGPYRNRAGHDITYLSLAGIMSISHRKGERPMPHAVQIADILAGSYNAIVAILAAVIHRAGTGEGQHLDISMTDGAIALTTHYAPFYLCEGKNLEPEEPYLVGGVHFYDFYQTKDGRYLGVGPVERPFYMQLCEAIGRPDLVNEYDFDHPEMDRLKAEMKEIIAGKTQAEWVEIFSRFDACVEPVLTIGEMCEHPLTRAREMVVEVPKPDGTTQRQIGSPFKLSATSPEYRSIGPGLGEHTDEVLHSLGYSPSDIGTLREREIVR